MPLAALGSCCSNPGAFGVAEAVPVISKKTGGSSTATSGASNCLNGGREVEQHQMELVVVEGYGDNGGGNGGAGNSWSMVAVVEVLVLEVVVHQDR